MLWYLWIGKAPQPGSGQADLEVFSVGGWLTHGDLEWETLTDFFAVAEHGLIPARARNGWARLRKTGIHSVWAPASQGASGLGAAEVGTVSLRGAPFFLPTFATHQFQGFLCTLQWRETGHPFGGSVQVPEC